MDYQICKRCILDTNIPDISFNSEGICKVCSSYEKSVKLAPAQDFVELEKKFTRIVKTKDKRKEYDCLCLYSGGKDSSYMLYNLVKKHHLRVLAFTLDNWFLSKQTFSNISKVLAKLNIDHVTFKPSWQLTQSLFKAGIFNTDKRPDAQKMSFLVGHVCWPCFVMISVFSIKTALEKNIPTIVVGTTPGQLRQKESALLNKFSGITDVYKHMVQPFLKIISPEERKALDLSLSNKIKSLSLKLVPFYEYHRYCEEEVIATVKSELGWEKPIDTDSCSSNCSINSLGIMIHKKRYNISPYLIPIAHDVREGLINRDKALSDVNSSTDKNLAGDIAGKLNLKLEELA
jgi:hypothetical protein